jgi:pimeloyl-ACP methyl ester carboxylesterase
VILVDTRGTGISTPRLGCPEFDEADRSSFYSRPFVGSSFDEDFTEALHACHDRLTDAGIDLSAYNSAEGAADLEALRTALGYRQWNLWAISADGVLGLTYMRLYPAAVRSAVLDSPVAPQAFDSVDYIRGTKEMLERALAGCAANAACEATYPNLRGVFYDIVHELQRHPAQISIPRFPGGPIVVQVRGVEFYLDAAFAVDPENIQHLFSEIWRSAHGGLAQVYRERFSEAPSFDSDLFVARGKTMSYQCHDGLLLYTPAVLQQLAADIPELASLVLSPGFGLPNGPAGCSIWDVGTADPAQHRPVSSRIATLVTSGEFDLGVPALMVRQVPGTLSNSRYFEFPATFHLQLASYNPVAPCARAIATQFLDAPTRRPDSSCFAQLPRFDYTP